MKIEIPSKHINKLLNTYVDVNRFRIKNNTVVLFYSDEPDFTIPVSIAFQILNAYRPIKKMKVKDERIYFKFRKSKPKNEVVMTLTFQSDKLNYKKCLAVASRYGDVKHLIVREKEMSIKYKAMISYFVAYEKFKNIAFIEFN